MRYKLYTFLGGWLSTPGASIRRYFHLFPDYPFDQLMKRPKEPMGNTGSYILYEDDIPLILAPETSYLFNYDYVQHISLIKSSLAKRMPAVRQQLSDLDEDLLKQATAAYRKLEDNFQNK